MPDARAAGGAMLRAGLEQAPARRPEGSRSTFPRPGSKSRADAHSLRHDVAKMLLWALNLLSERPRSQAAMRTQPVGFEPYRGLRILSPEH